MREREGKKNNPHVVCMTARGHTDTSMLIESMERTLLKDKSDSVALVYDARAVITWYHTHTYTYRHIDRHRYTHHRSKIR